MQPAFPAVSAPSSQPSATLKEEGILERWPKKKTHGQGPSFPSTWGSNFNRLGGLELGGTFISLRLFISLAWQGNVKGGYEASFQGSMVLFSFLSDEFLTFDKSDLAAL